jgi:ubiquinone/menaquinone biosynthesis C-methylase UbiE
MKEQAMPTAAAMDDAGRSFIPAFGKRWLLPLYDPFLWLFRADASKRPLIEQAQIKSGFRVLDIGCGTGTMAVLIKRLHPAADVVGIDPDPDALAVCKRKTSRAGLAIEFDRGFADHMPYADASFDRVFSSFMFHHLTSGEKSATLAEIRRVLKAGASLHLLDFVRAHGTHSKTEKHGLLVHRGGAAAERIEGRMTAIMDEAGFVDAKEMSRGKIFFGPIAYYRAQNPGGQPA